MRHLRVAPQQAGRRIDNFLLSQLRGVPRSRVYRMLRSGEVRVNGGRVQQDYRLVEDDIVRVPPVAQEAPPPPPEFNAALQARLERAVIYEDPQLLVIDKPAGMPVHGGTGFRYGLIEALRAARPHAPSLELVHRLDRDTSGCLLVAKDPRVLRRLHALVKGEGMDKRYLVLVAGSWAGGRRQVSLELARGDFQGGGRRMQVQAGGKDAHSEFTPVLRFPQASLLEARLLTGRTHQIRVHAAHSGHPVAGDTKYGDPAFNRRMRDLGLRRMFLHASSLRFRHPLSGRPVTAQAALPVELQSVLERLKQSSAR